MNAYSRNYNYIIIWSAKSGCTYFRQLFLELHKEEINNKPKNLWHTLGNDFKVPENLDFENVNKIILCRNPYYRVVSIFCNKYCGGKGHSLLPEKFKLDKCTFREFVKKIETFKKKGVLNKIDVHISEQNYYKNNSSIIKIENFDKEIIDVYKKNNLHSLIPKINNFLKKDIFKNKRKKNTEEEYVFDKEYTINTSEFPDYKYFYDKELLDLVYKIYENDFINFNYEKEFLDYK